MLRIPHYAERLLQGLDTVDWPEGERYATKLIGRSTGAEVKFSIVDSQESLSVYTTRPDTLLVQHTWLSLLNIHCCILL